SAADARGRERGIRGDGRLCGRGGEHVDATGPAVREERLQRDEEVARVGARGLERLAERGHVGLVRARERRPDRGGDLVVVGGEDAGAARGEERTIAVLDGEAVRALEQGEPRLR